MEFLVILIAGWVFSPVLRFFHYHPFLFFLLLATGAFLYRRRSRRKANDNISLPVFFPSGSSSATSTLVAQEISNLEILRLELGQQRAAGSLDQAGYERALGLIDEVLHRILADHRIHPDSQRWHEQRDMAWELLRRHHVISDSSPPWCASKVEESLQLSLPLQPRTPSSRQEQIQQPIVDAASTSQGQLSHIVTVPPLPSESVALLKQTPPIPAVTLDPISVSASSSVSDSGSAPMSAPSVGSDSPSVSEPSVLERTLQTISGWPTLLVPFLVQNILWFICGLCFVAGSTSLIASTSGQNNALAVSLVLLTYSGFLLWAGYRLCRTRPELTTSGMVLLALGVLLIPLNIASTVRLLASAQTGLWVTLGLVLTTGELFGFYYATMLVSGVMDRVLQGRHPQLFLALTAMQVTVPVLNQHPSWVLVATSHCILLGLLAYSAWQFTRDWAQSILGERRKVGYYAIGTLTYAAIVSCVHITWGATDPVEFPAGYAGPFLMAICGVLFYVDAQLKQWTKQYSFLSHLNFGLYGLSVVALLLSIDAPSAHILTLCLSLIVYSIIVWQYLTFVPLILMLVCAGWLYHALILQRLEPQWYLLASLPGLVGLLMAVRWVQRHRETTLIFVGYQLWLAVTVTLCFWSVGHSNPGFVAVTTILATMGLIYYGFRSAPAVALQAANNISSDRGYGPWLYIVTSLASVAVAYSPSWPFTTWAVQTASGWVGLSTLWTACGLRLRSRGKAEEAYQSEVFLNSALLNLIFALLLTAIIAIPAFTPYHILPGLLFAIGSVLLWQSLSLRVRGLLYGVLCLWGLAGVIVKSTYFPHAGSGAVEIALALITWTLLWWLEHESEESRHLRQTRLAARADRLPPLRLLWQWPLAGDSTYATLLRLPLRQTTVLLWLVGVLRLAFAFFAGTMGWGWTSAATMGMVGTVLGVGYFRVPLFLAVAVWLGLGAWLTLVSHVGFSQPSELGFAGVLFSFTAWKFGSRIINHPRTPRFATFLHLKGDRNLIETIVHWTTIVSAVWCMLVALLLVGIFTLSLALFCTLLSLVIFLSLAGWQYQRPVHSYLALIIASLTILLSYSWSVLSLHSTLHSLFHDHGVGLLATITGLACWALAWELTIQQNRLQNKTITRINQLYQVPLCHTALFLAVFAVNQQLALAWIDSLQDITTLALTTLTLASVVLFSTGSTLGHRSLQVAALLLTVLAGLWGESLLVHPTSGFTLWLGWTGTPDQWLTLSLAATGLALLTHHFYQQPERQADATAIHWAATITYILALLGTSLLFFSDPLHPDFCVTLSFLTLCFSLFPLLQPHTKASAIRSAVLPLISYPLLISLLAWTPLVHLPNVGVAIWVFSLWILANFVLPRWNTQHPQWGVTPDIWPWFGLLALSLSLASSFYSVLFLRLPAHLQQLNLLQHSGYLSAAAVYCFLMLRNSSWGGFSWIAIFLLTRVGSLLIAAWWAAPPPEMPEISVLLLLLHPPIGELLWLNLFLLIIPWWNTHGEAFATRLGWQKHNLPRPFILFPAGYFVVRLIHFAALVSDVIIRALVVAV